MRLAILADTHMPKGTRTLPEACVRELDGARLALLHDAGPARGRLARMRGRFPGADAVLLGHSHMPLHERDGAFQIFNPGSPTERRRAPARSMGIARIAGGEIELKHRFLDPPGTVA